MMIHHKKNISLRGRAPRGIEKAAVELTAFDTGAAVFVAADLFPEGFNRHPVQVAERTVSRCQPQATRRLNWSNSSCSRRNSPSLAPSAFADAAQADIIAAPLNQTVFKRKLENRGEKRQVFAGPADAAVLMVFVECRRGNGSLLRILPPESDSHALRRCRFRPRALRAGLVYRFDDLRHQLFLAALPFKIIEFFRDRPTLRDKGGHFCRVEFQGFLFDKRFDDNINPVFICFVYGKPDLDLPQSAATERSASDGINSPEG